jgi:flagellar biosynthesis protein FlhF
LIYDIDKPVSYFSIGQEVPDDIVPASSDFLVECILDGFEKKRGEHGNAGE